MGPLIDSRAQSAALFSSQVSLTYFHLNCSSLYIRGENQIAGDILGRRGVIVNTHKWSLTLKYNFLKGL